MTSKMFGLTASSMITRYDRVRAAVYDHEFSVAGNYENDREIKTKRITVYFPDKAREELTDNPPDKEELSKELRKFQESLYYANRRQRNYGHI